MIIFNLILILKVVGLSLDLYHVEASHDGDKSGKNNFLINGWNNHNLSKDSCLFDINISLLKAIYFDNHLNSLIGGVGANLQYFETVLIIFIQFDQSVVYLINLID